MADINVQKKQTSIWPWILGLVVLGLLVWLLSEMFTDDDGEEAAVTSMESAPVMPDPMVGATQPDAGMAAVPAPVQQYMESCAPREPERMSVEHQYTSDCIQQLTSAIDATLQSPNLSGVDVQAQLADARQKAQQLTQSSAQSSQHSGMTRDAFVSLAAVLKAMQDARFPELGEPAGELERTAQSLQPGGNLLDQRDAVQNFFRQAGDVLNRMSTPAAGV